MSPRIYENLINFFSSKLFRRLTVVLFAISAFYISFSVKFGVPPDENFHYNFIKLYEESGLSPILNSQDGYFFLGEVVKTPFFIYHYLLGLIAKITTLNYLFLRVVNIGLGLGSIYVVTKIAEHLRLNELVKNISIFMYANTLMFVFLSAAISYDNLFILASLLAVLFTLRTSKNLNLLNLVSLGTVTVIGSLTKVTFLPVALISAATILLSYFWQGKPNLKEIFVVEDSKRRLVLILGIFFTLFLSLALYKYASNLVTYGTYEPVCEEVLELDQCRQSALFVRNESIYGNNSREPDLGLVGYMASWIELIGERTYGVFGHKELQPLAIVKFSLLILVTLWIISAYRRRSKINKQLVVVGGFVFGYTLITLLKNYSIYLEVGRPTFAVHGRYLLGVLPLVYLLGNSFLLPSTKKPLIKALLVILIVSLFMVASIPTYLLQADGSWG